MTPSPPKPPIWGIALLSAAALAFEVLLTRLFSIIQWHHFSYMIISLALLGYGASGTFLALVGDRVRARFAGFFGGNAILFGISAVAGFLTVQRLPFNAVEIPWDSGQWWYLLAQYLLLAIPFFCVANCIGLAFMRYGDQVHRIYAFDLTGAGVGALGVVILLFVTFPLTGLWILGVLGLLAALLGSLENCWRPPRWGLVTVLGVVLLGVLIPDRWTTVHLSQYKGLSQSLQVVGAEKVVERSSPLGLVTVVRNRQVPFRYAPGLSLSATVTPPEQLGLFSDGEALGAITRFTGERDELAYLDYLTSALPYHLLESPHVLVLGAGGGADVLQAIYHQAPSIEAVELNPQLVNLIRNEFADFAGGIYDRTDVGVHVGEARGFIAQSKERYDLIQVALLDAFGAASAGLFALNESYLYTVEAFQEYLEHLDSGGMLSVTRWLRLPPRDSLRLFATAVVALERVGVADPGGRLLLIRGWKTTTLVVKNGSFSEQELTALRTFCRERSFDLAYYPGMAVEEANRFNLLERPYLYEGALAILGPEREQFFQRYKFEVTPTTDDRPYFFHFFKWRVFPELLMLHAGGGLGQLEWGYLILVATLIQALLAGVVLIILPLWLGKRRLRPAPTPPGIRWRVLAYFTAIGLGFLFLEMAFIQKFILFLSHPLYAVSVVLAAFLVFAGLGSYYSRYLEAKRGRKVVLSWAVAAIIGLAITYLVALPAFFQWALPWPDPLKIVCTAVLIAPLAFSMGMPFPLGLTWVAEAASWLIPWAWAINGCASVVSAVLAILLAVQLGFSGVVGIAVVFYLGTALIMPRVSVST